MERNVVEEKTVNYEEMAAQAEMEVEADKVSGGLQDVGTGTDEEDDNDFIVEFQNEYEHRTVGDLKKIKSIDLSGLTELTATDGEYFDRCLIQANHRPQNKFTDITYCKYVAEKVTGLPLEFFNKLKMRDMLLIVARIHVFFIYG